MSYKRDDIPNEILFIILMMIMQEIHSLPCTPLKINCWFLNSMHLALPTWGVFTNPLQIAILTAVVVPSFEEVCCVEHSSTEPFTGGTRFTILPVPGANNEH